ncbi:hypothetical protein [Kitasatospora sp. NPDC017646]|uniref:hypothetical protein n=1 Tax=Kitasatospora sp. NPDC017646 TaxID=3364024 RepID=UPI0037B7DF03
MARCSRAGPPPGRSWWYWWWVLFGVAGAGTVACAAMTLPAHVAADHPASPVVLSVFAGAFFGLLVDGEKWTVGDSDGA